MSLDDLANTSGEWLRGTGPESDIVISSRIRLARNLANYPFVSRASESDRLRFHFCIHHLPPFDPPMAVDFSTGSRVGIFSAPSGGVKVKVASVLVGDVNVGVVEEQKLHGTNLCVSRSFHQACLPVRILLVNVRPMLK